MPHTKRMFDLAEEQFLPRIQELGIRSLLYIGWRHDAKRWWHDTLGKGLTKGVLEIFPPNADLLEQEVWAEKYDCRVIVGDARAPESVGDWDLIFWDHGPEHVTWEDLQGATLKLKDRARVGLLYCCPWGHWPQGSEDGNGAEQHLFDVTPEHMRALGAAQVWQTGGPDQKNEGEILAFLAK
ncbi:MAG: hypothetical protein ACYDHY_07760 [Acidiferrobacterales bacterium]